MVNVAVGHPLGDGLEQCGGGFPVVDALEEAEKAAPLAMPLDMLLVENCGNAPDRLAVPIRQKGLDFIALVERMRTVADQFPLLEPQRRNPVRIVAIQLPRQAQKLPPPAAVGNGLNHDAGHARDCRDYPAGRSSRPAENGGQAPRLAAPPKSRFAREFS